MSAFSSILQRLIKAGLTQMQNIMIQQLQQSINIGICISNIIYFLLNQQIKSNYRFYYDDLLSLFFFLILLSNFHFFIMYIQQEEIVENHCAQIRQGVLAINKFVSYIHQLKADEITSQVVQMVMSLKNFCQQLLKKAKSDEIKLRVLRKRVLQLSVSENINKQRLQTCQAELAKADAKIEQLQKLNFELQTQKMILKSQIKQLKLNINLGQESRNPNQNQNQNHNAVQVSNQLQDSQSSIEGMAQCCEISFDSMIENNPDLYSSVMLEHLVHRDSNNIEQEIQEIQENQENGTSVESVEEMIQKLGISHANTKQSEEKTK